MVVKRTSSLVIKGDMLSHYVVRVAVDYYVDVGEYGW